MEKRAGLLEKQMTRRKRPTLCVRPTLVRLIPTGRTCALEKKGGWSEAGEGSPHPPHRRPRGLPSPKLCQAGLMSTRPPLVSSRPVPPRAPPPDGLGCRVARVHQRGSPRVHVFCLLRSSAFRHPRRCLAISAPSACRRCRRRSARGHYRQSRTRVGVDVPELDDFSSLG